MKTIGMIGGMSLESTMDYYRTINTVIKERLGDRHSARCLISSADCYDVGTGIAGDDWEECTCILVDGAKQLERGGADFMIICASTLHRVAGELEKAVSLPLLHIADATRDVLLGRDLMDVGLIGTRYSMEEKFNKSRLTQAGIRVRIPEKPKREKLHRIIFDELHRGIGKDSSRDFVLGLLGDFARMNVDAVIMGCSEISLLVDQEDTSVQLIDAARIHAVRAAELSLEEEETKTPKYS